MSNKIDERIIELKKKINEKKEELNLIFPKFEPVTDCQLLIDEIFYNLRTEKKHVLVRILIELVTFQNTAKTLGLENEYYVCRYHASDWIKDIQGRLKEMTFEKELQNLYTLEKKLKKLTQLHSKGKQIEYELDEIENLLK